MYDDLVNRLRYCSEEHSGCGTCELSENCVLRAKLLLQAADAIDDLEFACNRYEKDYKDLCAYLPKWIPVSERLPDSGVCVFVTDGLEVGEGWLTEIINTKGHFLRWCAPTADIDIDRRPITHWMPLPEPPKEEEA